MVLLQTIPPDLATCCPASLFFDPEEIGVVGSLKDSRTQAHDQTDPHLLPSQQDPELERPQASYR